LYDIMLKYSVDPYESHLIRGLKHGQMLLTGNQTHVGGGEYLYAAMPFDDSEDLLGPIWVAWLILLSK